MGECVVFYLSCLRERRRVSKKIDNFCKKGVDKGETMW